MATVSSGSLAEVDFREANIAGYANLFLTTRDSNYTAGDYRSIGAPHIKAEIFGTDFDYTDDGAPISGTITGIRETFSGQLYTSTDELSVPVSSFNYWVSNGLDAEFQSTILGGNDTIAGSPFGDYMLGYGGSDSFDLAIGDDTAVGGPGNDLVV
jgi:hypothetical protein